MFERQLLCSNTQSNILFSLPEQDVVCQIYQDDQQRPVAFTAEDTSDGLSRPQITDR